MVPVGNNDIGKDNAKLKLLDPDMVNITREVAILRTTEDFKREYKRRLSL